MEIWNSLVEKTQDQWFSVLASLAVGWFLFRQKLLKTEYNEMKSKIATLEKQHIELNTTLGNVKKNQELMRASQVEIQKDIKLLIRQTSKKHWWQP